MDDVLVVGEALVDIVARAGESPLEHPGGSPANVAIGLARLARSASLLSRFGSDARGRSILAHLESSGVRVVPGTVTDDPTSTATARLDPLGVASYEFVLDWRLPGDLALPAHRALHTGSIGAFLEPGGTAVLALVEAAAGRVSVSYDPNARPQLMGDPAAARTRVETFVARADIVKVSDEDLAWLVPGEDPVDVIDHWLGTGPAVVVLTRGDVGATAVSATGRVDVPAQPIRVVDTVGAGDSFMSGLLAYLAGGQLLGAENSAALRALEPGRVAAMLAQAVRVSAITCSRAGADPPTRDELDAWPD